MIFNHFYYNQIGKQFFTIINRCFMYLLFLSRLIPSNLCFYIKFYFSLDVYWPSFYIHLFNVLLLELLLTKNIFEKLAAANVIRYTLPDFAHQFCFDALLCPRNLKTFLLKIWAKLAISDSLIFLITVSDCHNHLPFRDNLFAISIVKKAMSLLSVKTRNTGEEYCAFDTNLFKNISASRISKVLHAPRKKRWLEWCT